MSITMKFKVLFLGLLTLAPAVVVISQAQPVLAQSSVVCEGLNDNGGFCSEEDTPGVNNILATAINTLSLLAGVAAVIMIIIGGAKYITSQGDAGGAKSAKNTILFAVIGLVIVAVAQLAVFFFIDQSAGLPATQPAANYDGPQ